MKKEVVTVSNILMPSIEEVDHKIKLALMWLYKNDYFLIENFANERSITHKFAEYIQFLFPECNVGWEYNKDGNDIKRLEAIEECFKQKRTDRIVPDIIVHLRNTQYNLLVIEAKRVRTKNSTNYYINEHDKSKIKAYTENPEYHYQFGLWIYFRRKIEEAKLYWFINQNGKCVPWQQDGQSSTKTLKRNFPND